MDKDVEKAKKIISDNIYMTIATATSDGIPWISPLFFAYDEKYNLYWVSEKNSKHSNLIRNNPKIAIVIFDSTAPIGDGDGVYLEATAEELSDVHTIKVAMKIYNPRLTTEEYKIKKIENVTNKAEWRIYKATPKKISTLMENSDTQIEVNLISTV
jgi:uncharacterized protein YhbP (UPF0306 family)